MEFVIIRKWLAVSMLGLAFHTLACGMARDQVLPLVPVEEKYPNKVGMVISSKGVPYSQTVIKKGMLPRGSALITSSGDLSKSGITHIIHAAPGSAGTSGAQFEPTLDSVAASIKNSMILAKKNGHSTVAIPFVGGRIFLDRIGVSKEELAEAIIRSALESRGDLSLRWVAYGTPGAVDSSDTRVFKMTLARLLSEKQFQSLGLQEAQVLQGDITQFSLHQATAIVNAANMECRFGGGISGAIAAASRESQSIDSEAAAMIKLFNEKAIEYF